MTNNDKLITENQLKDVVDTFSEIINIQGKQIKSLESGIIDVIKPNSPAPTERGLYLVNQPGIYTNFKDYNDQAIVVTINDIDSNMVYIMYNGTDCSKIIVPNNVNGKIEKGNKEGISGNEAFVFSKFKFLSKELNGNNTRILDNALIKVSSYEILSIVLLKDFKVIFKSNSLVSISTSVIIKDTQNIERVLSYNKELIYSDSKIVSIRLMERYRPYIIDFDLDLNLFENNDYDIQIIDPQSSITRLIKNIQKIDFSNKFNGKNLTLIEGGALRNGGEFIELSKAIKKLEILSNNDTIARVHSATKNNNRWSIRIITCDYNNDLNVTTNSQGYTNFNFYIPTSDTGLKTYELTNSLNLGKNVTLILTINIDELIKNDYTLAESDNSLYYPKADFVLKKHFQSSYIVEDFKNKRYLDSLGNDINSELYVSTNVFYLPKGSKELNIRGTLDKNANVLFADFKGHFLKFGLNNIDGTKYSGVDIKDPVIDIPTDAIYCIVSVKNIIGNPSVNISGFMNNEEQEPFLVHSALANPNFKGLYSIGNYLYNKKQLTTTPSLFENRNNITKISSGKSVDFELNISNKIIPSFNGIVGGRLSSIDTNGVMYFVNQNQHCIYKSTDGGDTFETIFDSTTHPQMFDTFGTQVDDRAMIVCLSNGELLFSTRMRDESATPNDRYWGVWITSNNQTEANLKFKFSYEKYVADRDPNAPNYGWTIYSTGCLLSDWTVDTWGEMIVVTEYGIGGSKYWYHQGISGGNARGISGRAWVSMDYGVTWKKMLDLDRKKDGIAEMNDNWYYFKNTRGRKMCHIHCIKIDRYRDKVYITNGDEECYIWSIDISKLKDWYNSAQPVNPILFPSYQLTDTFPDWHQTFVRNGSYNTFIWYTNTHYQSVQFMPIAEGVILGHDAGREFALFITDENIKNGSFIIEPYFSFEKNKEDITIATDGFSQGLIRNNTDSPIFLTHSGNNKSRIWATYDGYNWKDVITVNNGVIDFGSTILFDNTRNRIFLNTGLGVDSDKSGYYELKNK